MKQIHRKLAPFLMAFLLLLAACGGPTEDLSSDAGDSTQVEQSEQVPDISGDTQFAPEDPTDQMDAPDQESSTEEVGVTPTEPVANSNTVALNEVSAYSGEAFVAINDNIPEFTEDNLITTSFETYSPLDPLGRCGVAYACIGTDLMPTEDRGSISEITPSGWLNKEYDGQYLYNRCHLIGFQLSGENANERNLITGTRYMNVEGMLPFENMIADYVQETDNHVLYRVTPVFEGSNLVASGVQLEAESVEDNGDGVLFNVYVYNVQPGITIDYATGESWQEQSTTTTPIDPPAQEESEEQFPVSAGTTYVLNTNTKKFHYPSCSSVDQMSAKNRQDFTGTREQVIAMGYDACKRCNP